MSANRRVLSSEERVLLEQRGCSALSWDDVTVSDDFRPEQLRNVRFEGRTSIGSRPLPLAYRTILPADR